MEEKVLEILRDINPYEDISLESQLLEEGILESMSIMLLMSELEILYKIQISLDGLELDDFACVSNIVNLLKRSKKS